MKISLTAIVLCLFNLHITAEVLAQKVTLSKQNITLREALKEINKQTGYDFAWTTNKVKSNTKVSINARQALLPNVLKEMLSGLPLEFVISGKIIIINEKKGSDKSQVMMQQRLRGGIVKDQKGNPLRGVSIVMKSWPSVQKQLGQQTSTATDENGHWSLYIPNDSITLVFRLMGYENQEIKMGSRDRFEITMTESQQEIEGVVVTGMFTRKADTYTGSTTSFQQQDLLQAGSQNILQSLRNLDPSFSLMENLANGSNPNALPDFQLRGQTGFPDLNGEYASNPNLPLFILDGFETTMQKVIDLDIYRISSVTILKDAASKAIYGAKGANGVVVIETLRPKSGELRLTYNTQMGFDFADLSSYKLANAREKLEVELRGGVYTATTPSPNNQYILDNQYNDFLAAVESGVNTQWIKKPVRNGFNHRHTLRVEGGDERFLYGVDVMYNGISGTMKGSDRNLLSGSIDLGYRKNNFNIRNVLSVQSTRANNSPWGTFSQFVNMNPYLSYEDANGNIQKVANTILGRPIETTDLTPQLIFNPAYNSTIGTFDRNHYLDFTNNTSIEWRISPALRASGRFSFTKQFNGSDVFLPADHTMFTTAEFLTEEGSFRKGRYTKDDGGVDNIIGNLNVSYTKLIQKHAITTNGAYEMSSMSSFGNSYVIEGFPNDRLNLPSLGLQYMKDTKLSGSETLIRDMSLLGSGNYAYDQRYLFDVSYRATQSSQYGANNRWGHFWSLGLGWNAHNESFVRDLRFVDQFRLRATTGYTGSQGFNSYMSLGTVTYFLDETYMNGNGVHLMGLANPDLRWQVKQDHNFGVDFGFFGKFGGSIEYYISNTNNTLTDITLPPSVGFATYKANLGKVENIGFDVRLRYTVFQNSVERSFLNIFGNISHNKNTLKEISNSLRAFNDKQEELTRSSNLPQVQYVEGQSMNAIYAVPSLGIDPATGAEVYRKLDGSSTYDWSVDDMVVVGNALPDYSANFGFNLQYKGFLFNSTFRYIFGGQQYNTTLVNRVENANINQNVDIRVLQDRWYQPGDVSFFKNIADRSTTRATSRFVEDDNRLTLASVQLQYELDRLASIRALGFSRLRVGVLSNETFIASSMRVERGTAYPFARQFQFTLSANF